METLIDNYFWMGWNIFLAFTAVYFGSFMLVFKRLHLKFFFWVLWLLFMPNTIYVLTDTYHIYEQWPVFSEYGKLVAVSQYVTLEVAGIAAFLIGLYQLEVLFRKIKAIRKNASFYIFITNFVIAFGVVIGRIQRTNSWEVITNPLKVLEDSQRTLASADLLILVVLFGVIGNLIFFSSKRYVFYHKKSFKKTNSPLLSLLQIQAK